jgi:nitrate/TMAO reductase-like tetraheme cytochrome c subunit
MQDQLPYCEGVSEVKKIPGYRVPVIVMVIVLGLGLSLSLATAAVAAEPVYMGAKFCRTCHSSADNDRHHLWLQSAHASAFEVLKGVEKIDPECLSCHTTGYGKPSSEKTTGKDLRGVQCEACHGPGSEYKSMRVMKDPESARENGLQEVTRDTCLGCHR